MFPSIQKERFIQFSESFLSFFPKSNLVNFEMGCCSEKKKQSSLKDVKAECFSFFSHLVFVLFFKGEKIP